MDGDWRSRSLGGYVGMDQCYTALVEASPVPIRSSATGEFFPMLVYSADMLAQHLAHLLVVSGLTITRCLRIPQVYPVPLFSLLQQMPGRAWGAFHLVTGDPARNVTYKHAKTIFIAISLYCLHSTYKGTVFVREGSTISS